MQKPSPPRPSLTVSSTRTQPRAMPSTFSWPLVVPSALAGSGAGYLGIMRNTSRKIVTKYFTRIASILCLTIFCSGCAWTKSAAYGAFENDLRILKGQPVKEAYIFTIGYLGQQKPQSIKTLPNGNEAWTYVTDHQFRKYFFSNEITSERCTVVVEVDAKVGIIDQASSEGPGCWRAL